MIIGTITKKVPEFSVIKSSSSNLWCCLALPNKRNRRACDAICGFLQQSCDLVIIRMIRAYAIQWNVRILKANMVYCISAHFRHIFLFNYSMRSFVLHRTT